jgi:predicted component of type VI protein secretion system
VKSRSTTSTSTVSRRGSIDNLHREIVLLPGQSSVFRRPIAIRPRFRQVKAYFRDNSGKRWHRQLTGELHELKVNNSDKDKNYDLVKDWL